MAALNRIVRKSLLIMLKHVRLVGVAVVALVCFRLRKLLVDASIRTKTCYSPEI